MTPRRSAGSVAVALLIALVGSSCSGGGSTDQARPPGNLGFSDDWRPSIVVSWNQAAIEAIRHQDKPFPTVVSRSLFIVHQAMYEAYAAMDDRAVGELVPPEIVAAAEQLDPDDLAAVVDQAAYRALADQFESYETDTGTFASHLAAKGVEPADPGTRSPQALGALIAQLVIDYRADDGSEQDRLYHEPDDLDGYTPYEPGHDAGYGSWEPLLVPTGTIADSDGLPIADPIVPDSFEGQRFMTPHWALVEPYALSSADAHRPGPPPLPDSDEPYTDALGHQSTSGEAFVTQMQQVVDLGASLTDEQKIAAEYWADGPSSESPPGHWNLFAQEVAFRDRHDLVDDIRMFHALNAALFDAGVATWDAKRFYDSVRPVTAIPQLFDEIEGWAGPDLGTRTMSGENWRPYQDPTFVTPAFPEYVAGHSAFSAAGAEVLRQFTGTDQFADATTEVPWDRDTVVGPDLLGSYVAVEGSGQFEDVPSDVVTLTWPTFTDAADEAGLSRLYGGIHIQDGDLRGRELGRLVARDAFFKAQQLWLGVAEPVLLVRDSE